MLQQEPSSQEALNSAQIRVTPEELASAIASLEAKKAAEASKSAGTVTLGEAVDNLCLDATPDELLAEIQRQRAEKLKDEEPQPVISLDNLPRTRFPSESEVFKPLIIAMIVIIAVFFGLCLFFPSPSQNGNSPDTAYQVTPATPSPNIINQGVLVTDTTSQGPVTLPLSSVPDNHPVFCSYDCASTITPGFLARLGPAAPDNDSEVWTIVKHHEKVYLRGWIRSRQSFTSLKTPTFELANKPGAEGLGHHPTMLSLPLGRFYSDVTETASSDDGEDISNYEKILISDVHPDSHLWDVR